MAKRVKSKNFRNVEVKAEECHGNVDRMIKKFCNKVKKEKIIEEVRDRMYYEKPSVTRRKEKIRRKKVMRRLQSEKGV